MIQKLKISIVGLGLIFFVGCAQRAADVTISSAAFPTSGTALSSVMSLAPSTTVSAFKICVKRVKLEDADGKTVKKDNETGDAGEKDADDIRFAPGMIDVSAGTAIDWGKANIPVGFKLSKLKIKVKKDNTLCPGMSGHSIIFNSQSTDEDVEFRFKFNPALDLNSDTGALAISLNTVVGAIRAAADSNPSNFGQAIKATIESNEGGGQKK